MTLILALDAMGGDHAPTEICLGAMSACSKHPDLEVVLVGDGSQIERVIKDPEPFVSKRIHIVHTDEYIAMNESPTVAFRKKKRASIRLAMEMVKSGDAQGCISAGNTGAVVAGGVLILGRIPGIDRPGLGVPIPLPNKITLLIDVGATIRCKPINLYQFAIMGEIYMRNTLGVKSPTVALLSNGEEEIKGDEVVCEARNMLAKSNIEFIGYVEGKDIPLGVADVVVCDGFTGNVLLKFVEGVGEALYRLLREEMDQRILPKVGFLFLIPMLKELWNRFDYEKYGGTPLLGVEGVVIKAHGRSKSRAIDSALKVARDFVINRGVELIRNGLDRGGM